MDIFSEYPVLIVVIIVFIICIIIGFFGDRYIKKEKAMKENAKDSSVIGESSAIQPVDATAKTDVSSNGVEQQSTSDSNVIQQSLTAPVQSVPVSDPVITTPINQAVQQPLSTPATPQPAVNVQNIVQPVVTSTDQMGNPVPFDNQIKTNDNVNNMF